MENLVHYWPVSEVKWEPPYSLIGFGRVSGKFRAGVWGGHTSLLFYFTLSVKQFLNLMNNVPTSYRSMSLLASSFSITAATINRLISCQ